jgi:hypothetical protein
MAGHRWTLSDDGKNVSHFVRERTANFYQSHYQWISALVFGRAVWL